MFGCELGVAMAEHKNRQQDHKPHQACAKKCRAHVQCDKSRRRRSDRRDQPAAGRFGNARADEADGHGQHQQCRDQILTVIGVLPIIARLRQLFARNQLSQLSGRRIQAQSKIAGSKCRLHLFINNSFGHQIRNRAFEGAHGVNPHFPVILCHDHQHTITDIGTADFISLCRPLRVAKDVFRCRRVHHEHRDLTALGRFKRLELRIQSGLLGCR